MISYNKKRLRRRIIKQVKVYDNKHNLSVNIPQSIKRNLKIEKGDIFRFVTDRKRKFQTFEIIKKS